MVVLPDAGQGTARRKRRKEGSPCQQQVLVPFLPVLGWRWHCGPGSRESCPQALGGSLAQLVPMCGLPSGALPLQLGAENEDCGLHPSNLGRPSSTPCCVWRKEAPSPICLSPRRDEGRALFPRHHTREAIPATHSGPTTQPYRGFKVGDGSLEMMCKYANYFIMSLAWSGTHRGDKSLAATEMGKVEKSSKRDAKLPHPIFALCVSEWGGEKDSRLARESVASPPSTPWLLPLCLVNAAEHGYFGWNVFTYQVPSVLCLQYVWVLPSLVQEILSGREGGTMSFCFLYPLKQKVKTSSKEFFLQNSLSSAVVQELWRDRAIHVKHLELQYQGIFERTQVSLPRRCIFSTHHPQLVSHWLLVSWLPWSKPGAASTDLASLSPPAPQPPWDPAWSDILTLAGSCWPCPASCWKPQQSDHLITISIQAALCKAFYLASFLALLCIPSDSKPANRCGAAIFASKMFTPGSL